MVDPAEFDPAARAPVRAALGIARGRAADRLGRPPRPQEAGRGLPPRRRPRPRRRARRPLPRHRRPRRLHARLRRRAPRAGHRPRPRRRASLPRRPPRRPPPPRRARRLRLALPRRRHAARHRRGRPRRPRQSSPPPTTAPCSRSTNGVSGLLVPHEDPPAAAAALLRLIRAPLLRRRLGAALRAHVLRTYTAAAVVPQWQALFDAVLAERPPAPPPTLFRSFLHGGWECSTHRLPDRPPPRPARQHRPRRQRRGRLSPARRPRPPHHARRPALAPGRAAARRLRLLQLDADARRRRGDRHAR